MHDEERRRGHLGQGDGPARGFGLTGRRPAHGVVPGGRLARGEQLFLENVDDVPILLVHQDERSHRARLLQGTEQRFVVDHERRALVGHEAFQRRNALFDDLWDLRDNVGTEITDGNVQTVIDRGLTSGFLLAPVPDAIREHAAHRLHREIENGGRAPDGRRDRLGLPGGGHRPAEGQPEMDVLVNPPREDVHPLRIDRVRGGPQIVAKRRDLPILDEDVRGKRIRCRHDHTVGHQCPHVGPPLPFSQ